jgi:hypothetical protein
MMPDRAEGGDGPFIKSPENKSTQRDDKIKK